MRFTLMLLLAPLAGHVVAAGARPVVADQNTYTLYRSSPTPGGDKWRIHVATFDATAGAEYNRDNCEIAKQLFQAQPGVKVTYWCERGFFSEK